MLLVVLVPHNESYANGDAIILVPFSSSYRCAHILQDCFADKSWIFVSQLFTFDSTRNK